MTSIKLRIVLTSVSLFVFQGSGVALDQAQWALMCNSLHDGLATAGESFRRRTDGMWQMYDKVGKPMMKPWGWDREPSTDGSIRLTENGEKRQTYIDAWLDLEPSGRLMHEFRSGKSRLWCHGDWFKGDRASMAKYDQEAPERDKQEKEAQARKRAEEERARTETASEEEQERQQQARRAAQRQAEEDAKRREHPRQYACFDVCSLEDNACRKKATAAHDRCDNACSQQQGGQSSCNRACSSERDANRADCDVTRAKCRQNCPTN